MIGSKVLSLDRKGFEAWLRSSKASQASKERYDRAWRSGHQTPSRRTSASVTPKPSPSRKVAVTKGRPPLPGHGYRRPSRPTKPAKPQSKPRTSVSKTSTPAPSAKATPAVARPGSKGKNYRLGTKTLNLGYADFKAMVDKQDKEETRRAYWRAYRQYRADNLMEARGRVPEYRIVIRIHGHVHGTPIGSEGFVYASFMAGNNLRMTQKRLREEAMFAMREYDFTLTKVEVTRTYDEYASEPVGWK